MSDKNVEIWDRLGRTSPEHTKPFQRSGGFKGTAVRPVYTERKMTEQFGPCGIGWGVSEPTFQLVPGSDGQTAVYKGGNPPTISFVNGNGEEQFFCQLAQ